MVGADTCGFSDFSSSTLKWIRFNPSQMAIPTKNCATDARSSPPSPHSIGITTHVVLSLRNLFDGTVFQMRRALRLRPDIRRCHTWYVSWEDWPKNTEKSDGSTHFFANASTYGLPPVRALFYEFGNELELLDIDRQWLVDSHILVTPVLTPGATTVDGAP